MSPSSLRMRGASVSYNKNDKLVAPGVVTPCFSNTSESSAEKPLDVDCECESKSFEDVLEHQVQSQPGELQRSHS